MTPGEVFEKPLGGPRPERSGEEAADPTGRVLSVKWDMHPGWLPEGALPLLGMRGRLGSEHKTKRVKQGPSTKSAKTAKEGSSDVIKTTPMPEKKQQHGEKMALVKPRGSTHARASVQLKG